MGIRGMYSIESNTVLVLVNGREENSNLFGGVVWDLFPIPIDDVKRIYGVPFDVIASDLERAEDVRVLDFNGHHIFSRFSFSQLGEPIKVGD